MATVPHSIIVGSIAATLPAAIGGGDINWIRQSITRITRSSGALALVGSLSAVMLLWSGAFGALSSGKVALPGVKVFLVLAFWYLVSTFGGGLAIALNALGKPHRQAIYGAAFALIGITLMWWLTPQYGLVGVATSLAIPYCLIVLPSLLTELRACQRPFQGPGDRIAKQHQ